MYPDHPTPLSIASLLRVFVPRITDSMSMRDPWNARCGRNQQSRFNPLGSPQPFPVVPSKIVTIRMKFRDSQDKMPRFAPPVPGLVVWKLLFRFVSCVWDELSPGLPQTVPVQAEVDVREADRPVSPLV